MDEVERIARIGRTDGAARADGRELVLLKRAEERPQIRRQRLDAWTQARRRRFLDVLAATCNVSEAAAAIGKNTSNVYKLRQRDPEFRAAWADALECGYARLEAALLARAAGTDGRRFERSGVEEPLTPPGGDAFDPGAHEARTADIDPVLGLALLRLHRANIKGDGVAGGGAARGTRPNGRPPTAADPDELAESILRKLDALNKHREPRR